MKINNTFKLVIAINRRLPEVFNKYVEGMLKIKKGRLRELDYDDETGRQWQGRVQARASKNHEVRLLPTEHPLGDMDCILFRSQVYFFSLAEDIFVVMIESKHVASLMRGLFEAAWKQGKKG